MFYFLPVYLRLGRILMDLPEAGKCHKENGSMAGRDRVWI